MAKRIDEITTRIERVGVEGSAEIDASWEPIADLVLARAKQSEIGAPAAARSMRIS